MIGGLALGDEWVPWLLPRLRYELGKLSRKFSDKPRHV